MRGFLHNRRFPARMFAGVAGFAPDAFRVHF
jgi:hypothetical protein